MQWIQKHPKASPEMLGYIPSFFSENDPRPAREQIDENYKHGGGWRPFKGFKMLDNGIKYPGDPLIPLCFEMKLRDETIRYYDGAWLAIIQPDGSFEICRID
jgi:hypothetical protein